MSESMVGRIARRFFRPSTDRTHRTDRNNIAVGGAGKPSPTIPDTASPNPDGSVPEILRTGSMLRLGVELLEDVPRRLGPYRIVERIGEGGMGVVYLAEQDPPLVRRVAVKLARNAVPGNRALARFESERQTLAVMNHPNIARVFDAGSAPDARPYFVMEHVAGESITEFCDARRLGIEPRLDLFVRVCDGVQHAHLNAVIHRDIKPSNILVTTDAGPPTPKIIDFGVAKALDSGRGPAEGLTQYGQLIGTPEYMSPEQAALDGRPVDTRTDVYSLGIVFYELLVGVRPFERAAGSDASFVDLCRRIREEDPERPSARAARTPDFEAARRRGCVPKVLAQRLRRDLDAIAIKALSKDPAGRYATPSDMAADVERFLQHRPISARAPGTIDRLRKVCRRHRAATAAIAALSATLVGFMVIGTLQAVRAEKASARAEAEAKVFTRVSDFLISVLNPPVVWGGTEGWPIDTSDTPTRETLLASIRRQFADYPELKSQLLLAAGNQLIVHGDLRGEPDTLVASLDQVESLNGSDSPQTLIAKESLARTYIQQGQLQKAEPILLDVLERRRRIEYDGFEFWRTTGTLGYVYKAWQKHEKAVPLLEAYVKGLERKLGPDHRDVLAGKLGLSGSYLELRRYADTRALLEPEIDHFRRTYGEYDVVTTIALYNLGCARANLGDVDGAFRALRESIQRGWNYPMSIARDHLLFPLRADPRFEALERAGRLNGRADWEFWCFEAQSRVREGRIADAEQLLRDLIAAIERVDRKGPGGRAVNARLTLAKCWIRQGRFDAAERLLLPTLSAVQAERPDFRLGFGWKTLDLLAQCDMGRGKRESALERIAAAGASVDQVFENVEVYYHEAQTQALRGKDEEALRSLARISEMGFDDFDQLEHDLAFKGLRGRPEFVAIAKSARRRAL